MVDFEKFGCQAPLQDCNMAEQYKEMYDQSNLEAFNVPASKIMQVCVNAQRRLREIAEFKGIAYEQLLMRYSSEETSNCPVYVICCEDKLDIPTLLI